MTKARPAVFSFVAGLGLVTAGLIVAPAASGATRQSDHTGATRAAVSILSAGEIGYLSHQSVARASTNGCSLNVIYAVDGESSAAAEQQTSSWSLIQANGWTAVVPNGSWHLSASDAGADILSPDGRSDASLAVWYSLSTPWSLNSLAQKILGGVSRIHVICRSAVEHSDGDTIQATEFTGLYRNEAIHAVIILSLLAQTTPGLHVGETRSLYTSTSQWSSGNEKTMMLIVRRAIEVPQSPNG